jgi:hypothetical protein
MTGTQEIQDDILDLESKLHGKRKTKSDVAKDEASE